MPDMLEARLVVTGSRDHAATRRGDLSLSRQFRATIHAVDRTAGFGGAGFGFSSETMMSHLLRHFFKKPLEALSAKGEHHRARA